MSAACPDLILREATEDDLPGILALYADPELDGKNTMSLDRARGVMRVMRTYPWFRQFAAERQGRIAGTFALLIMDNIAHNGQPSALVEQVVVAAGQRSLGIGEAMMDHARALAAAKGCYKLALSSNLKREAAHRFYERIGFARHGYSFLVEFPEPPKP